jgi:hypothetical protein
MGKEIKMSDELMKSCRKWESCNAPICPLDDDWKLRSMVNGESVCLYLREYAKIMSGMADKAVFRDTLPEETQNRIAEVYQDIYDSMYLVRNKLISAEKSPSKLGREANWMKT